MAVKPLQSVSNALTVLEHLAGHQPLGVTALARGLDLDKMAVQRILVTLEHRGWVRQIDEPRGAWELTAVPLRLGETSSAALRMAARPYLERLAEQSGETALLFRRDGFRLVVIDGVDSHHVVRMTVPTGTEAPLTRAGALDAFLTAEERAALPAGPTEVTPRQLAGTRNAGYFVVEDMYPHSSAVGAPLSDATGRLIGTVLLVGPRERLPRSSFADLGVLVREAASEISDRQGV